MLIPKSHDSFSRRGCLLGITGNIISLGAKGLRPRSERLGLAGVAGVSFSGGTGYPG